MIARCISRKGKKIKQKANCEPRNGGEVPQTTAKSRFFTTRFAHTSYNILCRTKIVALGIKRLCGQTICWFVSKGPYNDPLRYCRLNQNTVLPVNALLRRSNVVRLVSFPRYTGMGPAKWCNRTSVKGKPPKERRVAARHVSNLNVAPCQLKNVNHLARSRRLRPVHHKGG